MQVFKQKNDVCLQNFIFLHKRLLFAGLCERILRGGIAIGNVGALEDTYPNMQVFVRKNANLVHFI